MKQFQNKWLQKTGNAVKGIWKSCILVKPNHRMQRSFSFLYRNNELFIWAAALIFLYGLQTDGREHFTLCIFSWLGIDYCPGCGIGRSIHAALHFDWQTSWHYHWFGIPALGILFLRMGKLLKNIKYGSSIIKLPDDNTRVAT